MHAGLGVRSHRGEAERALDSESGRPGFKSQLCQVPAVRPWEAARSLRATILSSIKPALRNSQSGREVEINNGKPFVNYIHIINMRNGCEKGNACFLDLGHPYKCIYQKDTHIPVVNRSYVWEKGGGLL